MRKRRLDLSLLQKDVANRLGVKVESIYNWENNRSSPSLRFIPSVIRFLGYVPYDTSAGTLGERLVALRRISGLTQKELAFVKGGEIMYHLGGRALRCGA